MGGKNKQRTKGNVRPSSSGRAAEVLTREGGVIPAFVGFGSTVASELSYVPAVHGAEDIDNLVDADFRLVLRKLSKRDVVTRLKAVQDFGSMCQERDADVVKGILPYWPRIYCKISVDHDRRIREATQQAFEQLVLKVRRSLAPFLKSLMGHWILSQCDTHTPAASAAFQAFQAAFSPAKQPEAIGFCKDEILNVLQDVLLKETADTLSDSHLTEEEREAKYVRMLTSSLLGVKRLLSLLLQDDRAALETGLAHLVNSGKFWKYGKHKIPQVRGAFFEMVCALCEFTPGLVHAEAARLCPAVLLSIDDTDPVVLPPVWEAVLHVVSTIHDCWTHVNAKKGFLPKLWALLKEGGKGMAKALHPNLMPLLSKLPPEVTDPKMDFFTMFFTTFAQGLSSERAVTSPSESAAIVTSFVECLRYCVLQNSLSHVGIFLTFRVNKKQTQKKKSVRLCFSKPEENEKTGVEGDGAEKLAQAVSELVNEKAFGSLQTQHFEDVVCQLAQLCLVHVNEKNSERHLVFLSHLMRSFHTPRVFKPLYDPLDSIVKIISSLPALIKQRDEGIMKNPAVQFLLERVVVWLAEKGRTDTEHLVEMVFSSLHCCSGQETNRILNHITTMGLSWGIILQIIQRVCSCSDWLKGSVLGEQLLGLTEELCKVGSSSCDSISSTSGHSWTLISLVLSQHHNNESLIGEVYMEKILEKLHATLSETKSLSDKGNMEPLISFICDVASTFFSSVQDCLLLVSAEELLLTVFQLTAQDQAHTHLSDSLLHKMRKVCVAGVQSLVQHCEYEVKEDFRLLFCYSIQVLVLAVQSVVESIISVCDQASSIIIQFFTLLMPSQTEWTRIRRALPPQVVSELLYALQWCKELNYSPTMVSTYHNMLTDWGLSEGLNGQVPMKPLQETLYTSLFPVSQSKLNTLQVLCPSMSNEDRESLVALATAGLVNWQEDESKNTHMNIHTNAHMLILHLKKNSREDWFLFSCDLSKATSEQLNLSVEIMRFLSWLVTRCPAILGGSQWDFLLCSMLAWLETASENVGSLWNPWVQLFVCENAGLIVKLNEFFTTLSSSNIADKLPPELAGEWTDFFVEGIYNLLLPLPVKAFAEPDDPVFPLAVLQSVGVALTHVPVQQLTQNSLPPRFIADQKTNLPEPLQTLLNTFCPLLLFKARPLQIAVYHILEKVMPQLPECDGEGDNNKSDDDRDEPCLSPPASLMAILSTCEELCDNILSGIQVGEFAVVQPLSVEYSCILGYLLSWKLLLTFFKSSSSHLRANYAQYLKRSCSLNKLLLHVFKLMPENPAYPGQEAEARETKTFFTERLGLFITGKSLPHLACSVYYSTVQDLPAMVRLWWNSQEKRVSAAVEKFTIKYISPVLSAQEISSVHTSTQMFDSMTVKARSAAREVIATYSVDDIFIELVIQLPQNYPLGSIAVESGRRVGVAVQQWRNWMLQLSTYLTHQNGSIMEGLALWKNNVDKRFEGIEDCMICFSVIHGSNYSLPKKACRTCKKKFHSACLYKWFTSSNKSTCPLCRETFF
uniref:E3 ubiquitin-protein ligase listerin n=1 Tax=Astatotilapia calliptera TaxID=8154 RepID=A0AAX7TL64_ASTCA